MRSVDIECSASRCELESLIPQGLTWTSDTTVVANDPTHSALHMCVNVDTSTILSGISHNIGPSEDFDSLLLHPNAMYASGFTKQNDVRALNVNKFPHDFSLRGRTLPGGSYISDFANSMFQVLPHVFPRAVSPAHTVMLGNSSALDSAIRNVSHPSTLQLVRQQSIDYQIIYMIFHRLINDRDAALALVESKTELDQLFVKGLLHCFSLGKRVLSSLVSSIQSPYNLALVENMFRAALILGNEQVLNAVLEMNQASLAKRTFTLRGYDHHPLEYAISHRHIQAMQTLLDYGADPNQQQTRGGASMLDVILRPSWGSRADEVEVEVLRLLFHHGLKPHPLQLAQQMRYCSTNVLSILATHCLSNSLETFFEYQGLQILLLRKDWDGLSLKMIETILNQGILKNYNRIRMWDSVLSCLLSAAILRRRGPAVSILLSMGATPNIHCLISAAQSNDVQIFEEFLSCGLDPNTTASEDYFEGDPEDLPPLPPPPMGEWDRLPDCTALSESIRNRSRGVFQILEGQDFVSKLSDRRSEFTTTFLAACEVGESALIEQLLAMPNFPRRREQLHNAIEIAVEEDQHHIVEILLSAGIKPTMRSLGWAVKKRKLTVVILLARYMGRSHGFDNFGTFDQPPKPNSEPIEMLSEAVRWGNQTAIEHVLKIGLPVNSCDVMRGGELRGWGLPEVPEPTHHGPWQYPPLSAAILARNTAAVRTLTACGVEAVSFSVHKTSYPFRSYTMVHSVEWILTPLAAAAMVNDLPLIRDILQMGADPFDNSAFFICSMMRFREEVVTLLLSAFKARYPHGAQSFGSDALYQTIRHGNVRLLELLARDVDLTGPVVTDRGPIALTFRDGNTLSTSPLGEAVRQHAQNEGAGGALDHLLPVVNDINAVVHKTLKDGSMTSLHWAISLGSLATVQKLHQAGANISLPAEWLIERTPLQAAAEAGSKDIVEYLLREGVNPNESPAERGGATALQLAAITGNIGIATILLDNGADINAPPAFCDGRTAFEGATEHGRIEMMIFLVSQNADLLSNEGAQCRRAMEFAENNSQHIAKNLAKDLYEKVLASQVTNVFGMGGDVWPGPDMNILGGLLS
jgi:ankyrin repeat protein